METWDNEFGLFFRYSKAVEIPKSAQKAPVVRTRRDGER